MLKRYHAQEMSPGKILIACQYANLDANIVEANGGGQRLGAWVKFGGGGGRLGTATSQNRQASLNPQLVQQLVLLSLMTYKHDAWFQSFHVKSVSYLDKPR